MNVWRIAAPVSCLARVLVLSSANAQQGTPIPPPVTAPNATVLIQSHGEPPALDADDSADPLPSPNLKIDGSEFTDSERTSIRVADYDLDVRLRPAGHGLTARARLLIKNRSAVPLSRIALQISSTLHWDAISANGKQLAIVVHALDTDADHTGRATEAVFTLPSPLAPGAAIRLDAFYSGTLPLDTGRLQRIGASSELAAKTDWDAVGTASAAESTSVALRGFGNVLWLPVSAPQLFLGDGAQLFQAIGKTQREEESATAHLRLTVEYNGHGPAAAYFCGRRAEFKASSDDPATASGVATADFGSDRAPLLIGFRPMSLFVLDVGETRLAALPGDGPSVVTSTEPASPMLAAASDDAGAFPRMAEAAEHVAPLVQQWFGPRPLTALTVLDHSGSAFEDGPLVVAPMAALAGSGSANALIQGLTHAWVATGQPWMDDGLAQFTSLLWTEQQQGRDQAIAALNDLLQPLTLSEPGPESITSKTSPAPGQALTTATDEIYYRRKAAAVWWMLRDLTGEAPLRQALSAWRVQPVSTEPAEDQARGFEHLLERTSGKDLAWFFNDWVLRDRGLPDLTIVSVTPRLLPAGAGHESGWLVSVTVRNEGAAAAEVPLIIRAGSFSTTRAIRVNGLAETTERILVEAAPTEVILNDGSVPEVRTSRHTRDVAVKSQ